MKPIMFVSDLHFHKWSQFSEVNGDGRNSRLVIILDALKEAAQSLRAAGGDTIYIGGDVFHVRGSVAPSVLNPTQDAFEELIAQGFKFRVIPGNHDLEGKESERLTNANQALSSVGCEIANTTTFFNDDKVVMIPWHDKCADTLQAMRDAIAQLPPSTNINIIDPQNEWSVVIHAPMNGVIKGIPDTGLDPEDLHNLGFGGVFVGHYHNHKQFFDNVWSIGALTHQTWSDVDAKAGFIIKDGSSIKQYESSAPKFIDYDDSWDDIDAELYCAGNYVRIRLTSATESEIKAIRESATTDWKARGCVVLATPKSAAVARNGSTIKSGASVRQSVKDWVDSNTDAALDAKDVYAACEDVLKEVSL